MARVKVILCQVKDLEKMDTFGQTDPFFSLKVGETEHKSSQKQDCLEATFDEEFVFENVKKGDVLKVEGFDGDMFNDAESFGAVEVSLDKNLDEWVELKGKGKKKQVHVTGRAKLEISGIPEAAAVEAASVEKKEQAAEEESDSDDDMPELEEQQETPAAATGAPAAAAEEAKIGKQNRSEKKSRKAMQKLGMRPVPGIMRVTVKKSKNILFVISEPDVFKSPASDTYIIFGEAKIEDLSAQAQSQAAEQFRAPEVAPTAAAQAISTDTAVDDGDDEEVDESGVDAKDIELVMSQAGSTRAKAVKALKNNSGDIVNAIMELTM
mmetsp:Transcript_12058/g.15632  ORF Transcript_12058/g.15632 Transcript_12058/m.15632 type:complete len:323 (-) Transcript_12058:191-1159(-)|eukprot:CAMPEP_0117751200 /NCGR_PEP_ID=MMETSP0947-20121206/10830_1 /TAXON_ID=44440 /ORGANISM="Chattonella subsalsa, Strain CCMP2191" /LENGTH=322 /DNA_ID=CAMNT_0005569529 /DNA_START=70 /DNA_END=1038 /DNA_ORIENTATION=+